MKNPFGDQQIPEPPGPYDVVKKRIYKKVSAKVKDQIRITLENTFANALSAETVMLSRSERQRLFSDVVTMLIEDILKD